MSADVIALASTESVDKAWAELCAHRRRLLEDGIAALLDREWVQEDARLDQKFRRLFMIQEAER